jgi:hypothetical protein
MLLAWKQAGVITYAGYILGFPGDTLESILHDVEVIKRELPVDLLEFFYLTPLPGSEDHQKLFRAGIPVDDDLNKYDLFHITADHPKMSREEWRQAYELAWKNYYTPAHMETVLRRAVATRASGGNTAFLLTWFTGCIQIENVHPLEGGFLRLKYRRDRRPTLPIESVWSFYPRYIAESFAKQFRWISLYTSVRKLYTRIKKDPKRFDYTDVALTEPTDDDVDTLEMFNSLDAHAYVDQERRLGAARATGVGAAASKPTVAAE